VVHDEKILAVGVYLKGEVMTWCRLDDIDRAVCDKGSLKSEIESTDIG
jgi:hypothetical protein